jgi:endoglucanase
MGAEREQAGLSRRDLLKAAAAGVMMTAAWSRGEPRGLHSQRVGEERAVPDHTKLPRWRGFNLLEKFYQGRNEPFVESDFEWIAEWGFDFVRLPLSYWNYAEPDPGKWLDLREEVLKEIDEAVEFGRQHGIHVNINFHRAPGFCVNPPPEPLSLWEDERALEACAQHWGRFADRYRGIPNAQLSFNLLNEPYDITPETYQRVARRLVEAIREEDPDRLVIADGLQWGRVPVPALMELRVAQSTRGYDPTRLCFYKAEWGGAQPDWPVPTWPLKVGEGDVWDKARLRREYIEPWKALEGKGVGVHVGEWGVYNPVPHDVALAWARDYLSLWKEAGWGYALWNFRGVFGILDSHRDDVAYEDFRGHKLDRKFLELLRES